MVERSVRRLLIIAANSLIIKRHVPAGNLYGRAADAQATYAGAVRAGE